MAIIVAAGKGLRMGGTTPKQYLDLKGKPVLWHTVNAFEQSRTDDILIVVPAGDENYVRDFVVNAGDFTKVRAIVPGGAERFDSCYRGLKAVEPSSEAGKVLIHDGVRALVEPELINRVIDALDDNSAVCPVVNVKDTIREVGDSGMSKGTLNRTFLRAVQTPQGFGYSTIVEAYRRFTEDIIKGTDVSDITDDAMLVERYVGSNVAFTQGSYRNFKITTPEDMEFAKAII